MSTRLVENAETGPFRRLLFALVGLLAGNSALLLLFLLSAIRQSHTARQAWDAFIVDALFSVAVSFVGWAVIGVPIALIPPTRFLSGSPWPLRLIIGAALGPLALLLASVAIATLRQQLSAFSLAGAETLWWFSIVVSTVSFEVYAALLRKRLRATQP
jgi:hypothetical protein